MYRTERLNALKRFGSGGMKRVRHEYVRICAMSDTD